MRPANFRCQAKLLGLRLPLSDDAAEQAVRSFVHSGLADAAFGTVFYVMSQIQASVAEASGIGPFRLIPLARAER